MVEDRRLTFTCRWFQRGVEADDPFDRFFAFWLALAVAAERHWTKFPRGQREPGRRIVDWDKIETYLDDHRRTVTEVLG